ncbi:MAG: 50S ribosomal protein L21 [Chlamydiales bacterium]
MTDYAIIGTGGKQYRVQIGDVIDVELLDDHNDGKIDFTDVLFFHHKKEQKIGTPTVSNFIVHGEILAAVRGPKVVAYKYKKRKKYRRKVGHRQSYKRVKIVGFTI